MPELLQLSFLNVPANLVGLEAPGPHKPSKTTNIDLPMGMPGL